MRVFKTIRSLREELLAIKGEGHPVSLVPTMGFLHEGHLSLIRLCPMSKVFVSIFVNPLQFNDRKDFDAYPIDIERDLELLRSEGVYGVFIPDVSEMYPEGEVARVSVPGLSEVLEGAFRPGHFEGVTTIVAKLFNIFEPNFAVFGEKDFQQLKIIEKMVSDLCFGVKIIRGPIVREESGLAMSSRNSRLSAEGRQRASELSRALFKAKGAAAKGEAASKRLKEIVTQHLLSIQGVELEYVEVVSESSLASVESLNSNGRLLAAVWVDGVRLIDNVIL